MLQMGAEKDPIAMIDTFGGSSSADAVTPIMKITLIARERIRICDEAIDLTERELRLKISKRLIKNSRFLQERLTDIRNTKQAFEAIIREIEGLDRSRGDVWYV